MRIANLSLLAVAITLVSLPAQSGWSAPVLETTLNTAASDAGPHLSYDGRTIHFASFRSGNWEIYSATRPSVGGAWTVPVLETALSDPAVEDQPFLSADGLSLYFSSSRAGGMGGSDIMVSTRPTTSSPWGTPSFVTEINSAGADSGPSLTADGLEIYFLTTGWGNPTGNNNNIFRATRASTALPFGTPTLVAELLGTASHRDGEIAPDGLTIHYTEPVASRLQVMRATRTSRSAPFGTPAMLSEFATTANGVFGFTVSLPANEAFLAANFPVASGSQEIMRSRFDGLTRYDIASSSSTMTLPYRDSTSPFMPYLIGASLGNTGWMIGTRHVPLDPDWLLVGTLGVDIPPWTIGWVGVLNAGGEAAGTVTNFIGAFTGLQFYVGAFTLDPSAPFGVKTIANSFPVLLQ